MDTAEKKKSNALSIASLVFGIAAFAFSWTIVGGITFAGLSITFGFLSRGKYQLNTPAFAGILLSVIGLAGAMIAALIAALFAAGAVFELFDFIAGHM